MLKTHIQNNNVFPISSASNINEEIEKLDALIDDILIEHEGTREITQSLFEKTQFFTKSIEVFFDNLTPIGNKKGDLNLSEEQIQKITLICRKANESESFQLLLYHHKIHNNHPKIFFNKLNNFEVIPGDEDRLETEPDGITPTKKNSPEKKIKIEIPPKNPEIEKNAKLMEEVQSLVKECESINVSKPYKILQKLETLKEKHELDPKLGKFFSQIFQENAFNFAEIKKDFDYLGVLLRETEAKDWIHEKSKGKIHVYYKIPAGTPTCSLKFEAEVQVPVKNLAAIVYETDLMNMWVPFCKISKTLKKVNKACKAFYNEMDLPFISNREAYCVGYGINRLEENGTILIVARTIDEDNEFQQRNEISIPAKTKLVRMEFKFFITEVTPIDENNIKVRMVTNINPKLKVIPISIINFFTRKFGIKIFELLVKKASKDFEKSAWFKSMNSLENQDFYGWLETSILPYLRK